MAQRLGQRPADDLDRLLGEADSLLAQDDDLIAAARDADALLAAPTPAPSTPPARRPPPGAAPVASPPRHSVPMPRVTGPAPPGARPGQVSGQVSGRLGHPSDFDRQIIAEEMARHQPPPAYPTPPKPIPPGDQRPTVLERLVDLPTLPQVVGQGARGFAAGTLGTVANVTGAMAARAFAKTPEEAQRLTFPAQFAKETLAPPPDVQADVLDDPTVLADPRWWSYMGGQLMGSIAALAATGGYGRAGGQAAASVLAGRLPGVAAKLATWGGPAASAGAEALVEASDTYTTLVQQGQDPAQAAQAAEQVFAGNLALLGVSNHPLFEAGGGQFRKLVTRALSEGGQETGQQVLANVAQGRDATEGLGTAALAGALGGPMAGAALDAAQRPRQAPIAAEVPASPAGGAPSAPVVSVATDQTDLRAHLEEAIGASRTARQASGFAASPAAQPNDGLADVLAEADEVLAEAQAPQERPAQPPAPVAPVLPEPTQPSNSEATAPPVDDVIADADRALAEAAAESDTQAPEPFPRTVGNRWEPPEAGASRVTPSVSSPAARQRINDLAQQREAEVRAGAFAAPAVDEAPREFSSTQINLPDDVAGQVRALASRIPDEDLAADGREDEPHITVQYGIESDDAEPLRRALAALPPVRARLGKTSLFENADADVVKVDVDSPDLRRVRDAIRAVVDAPGDTHQTYTPHATVAYVKPGRGRAYADNASLEGREVLVDRLVFSTRDRQAIEIPLAGATEAPGGNATFGPNAFDPVIAEADAVLAEHGATPPGAAPITTLDTGEQQPRLPGEVGAVRDEERAQPREAIPPQSLTLTAEDAPTTQGRLAIGGEGRGVARTIREKLDTMRRRGPRDDVQAMPARDATLRERLQAVRASAPARASKGRNQGMAETWQRAPGTKTLAETPEAARPSEIVRRMADLFKTPVGVGRLVRTRALGYFVPRTNQIQVRVANALPVLFHEFGHASKRHLALALDDPRWAGELIRLGAVTSTNSYTGKQRLDEGLAEFWRAWTMDPDRAKMHAPQFHAAVERRLDEMGTFGTEVRELKRLAQAFLNADPATRIALRIDFDGTGGKPRDIGAWVADAAAHWIDDLHRIRQAEDAMAGGHPLPPSMSAYMLTRNARGSANMAADFLEHGIRDESGQFTGPSLRAALSPVKDKLADFSVYLVVLRARELHGRRIETGLTDTEVTGTIRTVESGPDAARFAQARDAVYAYQAAMLDYAVRAGVLSPQARAAIQRLNQFYVPLQRVLDGDTRGGGSARRIADRLSPVKRIKGSGRDIINPLESIIANTYTMVDTVQKNRAMQALARLADTADDEKVPGTGPGCWMRRIADPQKVTGVNLRAALTDASKKAGQAWRGEDGQPTLPPDLEALLDELGIEPDQVIPIFETTWTTPKGEQIVTVLREGRRQFYQITDPLLFDALTQIAPMQQAPGVLDGFAQMMAKILRAGATLTVGFIARNPGRDTLTAFLQSRHGFIPLYDTLRGLTKTVLHDLGVKSDEEVALFYAQGITQGTLVGADRSERRKKLRHVADPVAYRRSVVTNPLELLQAVSAYSEIATRVGEFSLALRQGGEPHTIWERLRTRGAEPVDRDTLAAATLAARDVTTDFSKSGSRARALNRYAAFFNARIQGYVNIAATINRAVKHPGTDGKALAHKLAMLSTLAVALKLLNDDDDDYRELSEDEKLTYWHWRPSFGTWQADSFIRIPKPFEWAFVPNLAEAAVDFARERNPEAFALVKAQAHENARQFALGFLPTAATPPLEVLANYSFFRQRPIVSPWDADLPLEQQAGDWTTQTARALTRAGLPLAPAKIDHLLFGYTAGLGRTAVTWGLDPALRLAGVAPPKATEPEPRWEEYGPFLRSAAPKSDAGSLREFYDAFHEMSGQTRGYNRANQAGDAAQAGRILAGVERKRWRGREDEMKAAKKRIDAIADEIDAVYAHATMTPEQKRVNLDGMRRAMVYEARVGLGYESTNHIRRSAR